jgi:hypothetical protein
VSLVAQGPPWHDDPAGDFQLDLAAAEDVEAIIAARVDIEMPVPGRLELTSGDARIGRRVAPAERQLMIESCGPVAPSVGERRQEAREEGLIVLAGEARQ